MGPGQSALRIISALASHIRIRRITDPDLIVSGCRQVMNLVGYSGEESADTRHTTIQRCRAPPDAIFPHQSLHATFARVRTPRA
jgi:hypothetical protein